EHGREHDVHPRDEARRRDGRPLQARGLQRVADREQRAERAAGERAAAAERAEPRRDGHRERQDGDREPDREEREQRVGLEGVLDLDEGDAPNRSDEDGPTTSQYKRKARRARVVPASTRVSVESNAPPSATRATKSMPMQIVASPTTTQHVGVRSRSARSSLRASSSIVPWRARPRMRRSAPTIGSGAIGARNANSRARSGGAATKRSCRSWT